MTVSSFDKFFEYCLKIFLVVCSLFYMPMLPGQYTQFQAIEWGYMTQELFFRYGVLFLFGASLLIKPKRVFNSKSLGILIIYVIVSGIFIKFDTQARRAILNLFIGILFYKTVYEHIDFKNLKSYGMWFFWLLFANLILCFMQYFRIDPIFDRVDGTRIVDLVGFMRIKATLGILAVVLAPFLVLIHPLLVLITLPLLWYSQASSAALAFCAAGLVFAWVKMNKKLFWPVMGAILIAGGVYVYFNDLPGFTSSYDRFEAWLHGSSFWLKRGPFLGIGAGSFAAVAPQTAQETSSQMLQWIWMHNDYLQSFFEFGIFGGVIITIFIKSRLKQFNKYDFTSVCLFASFVSILIVSFFNFPFHLARMAGICLFLMAVYHARTSHAEI